MIFLKLYQTNTYLICLLKFFIVNIYQIFMLGLTKNQECASDARQVWNEWKTLELTSMLECMRNQVLMDSRFTYNAENRILLNEDPKSINFVSWMNLDEVYWMNINWCNQMAYYKSAYFEERSDIYPSVSQPNDYLLSSIKQRKDSQGNNSEYEKLWSYTSWHISETQTNECKGSDWGEQDDRESDHKTFWSWGLSKDQTLVVDKILTPNNIEYLEALKEFDYEIEEKRKNSKSNINFVFIWKHEGKWNKVFQRWWNLLDHCRSHKGIRPYKWDVWGKQFTQKGNLNKHLQLHS